MINLNTIKKNISTGNISFLIDVDRSINIDKSGKNYHFTIFQVNIDLITNFIINLEDDKIYLIIPLISINRRYNDPYLTLSRQFLISNKSDPNLISDYILEQIDKTENDFEFKLDKFFLILKYKPVYLDYRIFSK
jgi:hypothetical protein